jgi:hypothetical protein
VFVEQAGGHWELQIVTSGRPARWNRHGDDGDGVWIDHSNGISEWELNVVNGKQARTDCLN